ncbi:hypothetical protein Plhal304r1_c017g0061851 [Plasmopara halstedii]
MKFSVAHTLTSIVHAINFALLNRLPRSIFHSSSLGHEIVLNMARLASVRRVSSEIVVCLELSLQEGILDQF